MEKLEATRTYWLTTNDFDEGNYLKPAAVLNYFQDIASWHAECLKAGYSHLLAANKIWILLKNKFVLYEHPDFFSRVKLSTWPLTTEKIYYPRAYQMKNDDGKIVGEGMSLWAIINLNTQMVTRDQWFLGTRFKDEQPLSFQKKIASFDQETFIDKYTVRSFDLDHYHHMNNAMYANLIHLVADRLSLLPLTNLEIHYLRQAKINDVISLYYHEDEQNIYITGKDDAHQIIFSSLIEKT